MSPSGVAPLQMHLRETEGQWKPLPGGAVETVSPSSERAWRGEGSCMRVILDDSVVPAGRAELQGDIRVPSPRGSAGECPASGGGPAFAEPCGVGRPCQGRGRGPWRSPWPQAPWAPGTCCGPEPHPQNWFSGGQGGTETEHAVPRNANDPAREKGSAQPPPGAGSRCPCLGWRGKPLLRSARRGFVSGRGERGPPG